VRWPLADHLGSIRDVAVLNDHGTPDDPGDDSTDIVNHLVYDSFGRITSQTDSGKEPFHTFTGRDRDPVTELSYHRARWYAPATGRWLTEDPIGFASADANLYRYCGNNVSNAIDPDGLEFIYGPPQDQAVAPVVGLPSVTAIPPACPTASSSLDLPLYTGPNSTLYDAVVTQAGYYEPTPYRPILNTLEQALKEELPSTPLFRIYDKRYGWIIICIDNTAWAAGGEIRMEYYEFGGQGKGMWVPVEPAIYAPWQYNLAKSAARVGIPVTLLEEADTQEIVVTPGPKPMYKSRPWGKTIYLPDGADVLNGAPGYNNERGMLTYGQLDDIYNELFSVWFHTYAEPRRKDECCWLFRLIEKEVQYPEALRLEMVEEAMSETISAMVITLGAPSMRPPQRRRSIDIWKDKRPPGHTEYGEKWYDYPQAKIKISDSVAQACIWVLENGCLDPRSAYPGRTVEEALQEWYRARWWPERPRDSRVDRIGRPW